jgi:hypothetical protein
VKRWTWVIVAAAALSLLATPVMAGDYHRDLAVVNDGLANNPSGVPSDAVDACKPMRDMAITLYKMGKKERAERRLDMCKKLLKLGGYQ